MIYLMPMAGAGSRFQAEGYTTHKPVIPTTDWRTGQEIPMVIAAAQDLPNIGPSSNIIFVDREFHKTEGVQDTIRTYFKNSQFVTLKELTEGQACSCLEAKKLFDPNIELMIGGCDNGMIFSAEAFNQARSESDVLVFTYRNNEAVLKNPNAYGWVQVDDKNNVLSVSVKKSISSNPLKDHAIVSSFWYNKSSYFVDSTNLMIETNDRINNEFYIDQSINYCLKMNLRVKVFEIDRYLCWGTPKDYENYQNTIKYWKSYNENL